MSSFASILKTDLSSLAVRLVTVDSADGIRLIGPPETITLPNNEEGILSIIGKATLKAVGWLFNVGSWALGGIATFAVQLFVTNVNFVMNFNWNATDEELRAQLLGRTSVLAGQLGGTLGNFLGFAVVGTVAGVVISKINPLLAVKVLWDLGEEALEELCSNLTKVVRGLLSIVFQSQIIAVYGSMRYVLKKIFGDPQSPIAQTWIKVFGPEIPVAAKNWGEKGSKPFTFAGARDEWVESLPRPIQDFTEELLEEFWDGFTEGLYIVAADVDEYIAEQQIQQVIQNGPDEVVEIIPDRENPEEKLILAGPQELLRPAIVQTLATHQMLQDRESGITLDGKDLEQAIYTKKGSINNLMIKVRMFSNPSPPFYAGRSNKSKRFQYAEITVPHIERSKLDWEQIVAALGGQNGYFYGSYQLTGQLIDDQGMLRGKIIVSAQTEDEAGDRIEALATLTGYKVNDFTRGGTVKRGERGRLLWVEPIKIYPADVTIINAKKIIDKVEGRKEQTANYKRTSVKLPLWQGKKPDNWEAEIMALYSND